MMAEPEDTAPTQVLHREQSQPETFSGHVLLLGNPNTGKTTFFNRVCGVRAKTANFPGSTVDARVGTVKQQHAKIDLIDLPGIYGLDLATPESDLARNCLDGHIKGQVPDAVFVMVDATNLGRGLRFAAEILTHNVPTIVLVNMIDTAQRRGISVDTKVLEQHLGCPVVATSGRTGKGIDQALNALASSSTHDIGTGDVPAEEQALTGWSQEVVRNAIGGEAAIGSDRDTVHDRLDAAFTHPILGILAFSAVMIGLFATIFSIAAVPMDLIDVFFESLGGLVSAWVPPGAIHDLLIDGVIGGLAGTLIFLPQICLLFFLLTLLEDTGYLARAAFVIDRVVSKFGLPGQAFVPLLSSHACALPGIMATRMIPDPRDRLATILVAPFMSCTARIPVYVLLTSILFFDRPWLAGLAFAGCYILGGVAALLSAFIARRTILPGRSRAMMLELPDYRIPSLRNALLTTWDRAVVFLKNAGTIIMGISIVMWWLSAYPNAPEAPEVTQLHAEATALAETDPAAAEERTVTAEELQARVQQKQSFAGRIGSTIQPLFAPIGLDDTLTVSVLTSFLAREVFVSTTVVLLGTGDDVEDKGVVQEIQNAQRPDGTPLFNLPTSASLLVFFVLAMQCLPTLAVTRRESGSWKWPALQFVWMTVLAYALAAITYALVGAFV